LEEVFGAGTAVTVSPVGCLAYRDKEISTSDGRPGPVAQRLLTALTDIQYGIVPDPYGWVEVLS